ncbi:MAG: DUF3368 domain-containing protein [Hormoscilla sp. GM7CHS1pb]|nr:DUF3368 domain-containing protein [Hormoscilla sp. GM7CHS1pb]
MIVVSNTSPIISMAAIGQLNLLQQLYNQIIIPTAVYDEIANAGKTDVGAAAVQTLSWIKTQRVTDYSPIGSFPKRLNAGENEAIALAIELNADLLLIDEKLGRKVARSSGLKLTGVLGILMAAKRRGLIPVVKLLMDDLIAQVGFRVNTELYAEILQQVGE